MKARIALVGSAVLFLLVMWQTGWLALFTDPERLRDTLVRMGPMGYFVYLGAFTALQPLGVPGIGFVLGATYVWPKPVAFALAVVGSMSSSTVGFAASRFVARDWVLARLPLKLRAWEGRLARKGLTTTIVLRLIFLMNPFVNGLLGVSHVRLSTYLLGSLLGFVPALAVVVWVGAEAMALARQHPVAVAMAAAVAVAALTIARLVHRSRHARTGTVSSSEPES